MAARTTATTKLFVGNVPRGADPEELKAEFTPYGTVAECDILSDYAFVHFADPDEAEVALRALNGKVFHGSVLKVEKSTSYVRQKPGAPIADTNVCYVCNQKGHYAKNCPDVPESEREKQTRRAEERRGEPSPSHLEELDRVVPAPAYDDHPDYPPRRRRPAPPGYHPDDYYSRRRLPPRYYDPFEHDYPPPRRLPPAGYYRDEYDYPPPPRREVYDYPPIRREEYDQPPIRREEYDQPPIRREEYDQPPLRREEYNQPPLRREEYDQPPLRREEYDQPPLRRDECDQPPLRRDEYDRPPLRRDECDQPPLRRDEYDRPPLRRDEYDRPPLRRDEYDYPPIRRDEYPPLRREEYDYPPLRRAVSLRPRDPLADYERMIALDLARGRPLGTDYLRGPAPGPLREREIGSGAYARLPASTADTNRPPTSSAFLDLGHKSSLTAADFERTVVSSASAYLEMKADDAAKSSTAATAHLDPLAGGSPAAPSSSRVPVDYYERVLSGLPRPSPY